MLNDLLSVLRRRQVWHVCALSPAKAGGMTYHNATYTSSQPLKAEHMPMLRQAVAERVGSDADAVIILSMTRLHG